MDRRISLRNLKTKGSENQFENKVIFGGHFLEGGNVRLLVRIGEMGDMTELLHKKLSKIVKK